MMRKIVIASDSFKGSLSSQAVAQGVELGVHDVFPECAVRRVYIADGGEGTVEALVGSTGGQTVSCTVADPLGRPVEATYGVIGGGGGGGVGGAGGDPGAGQAGEEKLTAVIEMSAASGLPLVAPADRNPEKTTTFGTGELIRDALARGCRRFLVGIGGSATNDAGSGMLQALGFRFLDADGNELGRGGEILGRIATIDASGVPPEVRQSEYTIACDVTAPLSGPTGAAYVFAPQKGADPQMVARLDAGLAHFARVVRDFNGAEIDRLPGAGAAGGLGGGFAALLGARLISGIEMVLGAVRFAETIADADLIITGEGKLDAQTAMGKAPRGVLDAAARAGIPVVAIGGAVESADELVRQGFAAVFPIVPGPVTLAKAMEADFAQQNIRRTVGQIMRIFKTTYRK